MKYCPICEKNYGDETASCEIDGATLRESGRRDTLIGKVVKGRYRVLEKIGEGGMGAVYLAEQVAISRKVALKVLHTDYARDEEFVKRFRQEAKLAASLNHHNVVTIFDFDQADDGSLYIVMEYVGGKNLARVVREGPMEIRRALRLAVQIAEGLTAAHRAGVIHRDVKPENIMVVGAVEEIKLMDFGISRLRDTGGASRLTRSGTIMGTPAYMAPEQIEGEEVSERTDIYAFGIVLYEMLSGSVPFQARTPEAVLIKHLQETAVPLRKIRREVPSLVERAVTQALEKEATSRQSSMQAVVEILKETQRRADVTKSAATRVFTEPLAKLGHGFGSAALWFGGLLKKERVVATIPWAQETANLTETPAAETVAAAQPAPTVAREPEENVMRSTALAVDVDAQITADPSIASEAHETVVVARTFEKFHAAVVPAPEPVFETGQEGETEITVNSATTAVATTVMAPADTSVSERTTVVLAPVRWKIGKESRWKWISTGALTTVVMAGMVYYLSREQSIPDANVVSGKANEMAPMVQHTPATAGSGHSVETEVASYSGQTEGVTVSKAELQGDSKKEREAKIPEKKNQWLTEAKAKSKAEESTDRVELKGGRKPDSEKTTKEKPTEIASLKPAKTADAPATPVLPEVRLVALTVLADKKELNVDGRTVLTVKGKYSDGKENEINGSVHWESSDRSVASVNSRGELEARKEGKAQITASYSGLTSPSYTFSVKGVPQAEKSQSGQENIQDLRRRLLR